MFLQRYLLGRELILFVLLCAINIYAPNGMEQISKEEASSALSEPSPQKASAIVNTESVTILEPKQSEHYESVDQDQAVTVKEVSTSELQDLVITPTVAPATPHYDTDISHSSSIIKIVLQNDAPEQNNTHKTVEEPKKNESESKDSKDDTRPNQDNVGSKTAVVQDEVEKADENHTNNVVTEDIAVRLDSPPSEDTDSITATLKQAEEETSAKEEEMPSFDEFKKKLLEEEKSKIKQQQQQDPLTPHQPPVKPKSKKIKERKKSNYAAIDCGAKILSSNPEASNALSILVENRDLYMLNPCSKQIWFIVELCELVQVKTIEIANFELFSSTPESFRVYVSSRFPTRDWTMLGTFQARDERDIQSFPLDEPIYAKYLKVEMVSHFGSQHYCPLSLFRVFGVSMVEEYEDHESGSTESNEDEEVIPVLPPDPGVSSEKEEKKPNILEEAANKVFNFVKEAAIKITQVVQNSNETTGKNPEESVGNKAMDESKQKIVTLIGKDEAEDSSTIEHGNQTLNESIKQTIEPKSSDHIRNHSRGNDLGEVRNKIKLKSNMKCTFGTMLERFLHSLGDSSNCSCTLGKILCFKSNKLQSSRNSEEMKINLKNLSSTSVVSKSDPAYKPKQITETILQEKSKLMDEESSSISSDFENRLSASSVTSSLESNKESITESSTIVQNQEVESIDSEQKAAVNQTADKIQITTFIQPSKAKETLSRHFVITPKGSETPHLPLAATVTVKPGNSTVITDKPSLETKETVVTEKDPEDKSHSSAAMTGKQGNNEGLTSRQKGIKQSYQQSHVKSEIPNETDTKIKNVVTQIDSISSDASEQPKSTIDSKEPGCDVQIDALASQSSSASQCSAVNSIEMMNHPVPGVDVLEIKLAVGTKEATAHPQHPDSGTQEKQKDPSVDDKQDLPSNAYLKDEGFKEGNATATMQEVSAEKNKDAESTSADDTDLKLTESLSSEASVVNKPISNLEESIPPIPVPPVVQQDTQSTTVSAKPSSTKSSSATITTPNEEHSVPDTSGGAGTTETMLATDASLETNYPSLIDKMVAQVGSTSVPNIGSSATQKESIFLRLSNKIKALEQNLTLSTRYMEQLNQRYRKSLEEIQKKFDKRINVLTNATKLAEALIKSQKEQITKLQEKQKEMNNIVERMAEKMHRLNQEVMERHIVGLFLEIVLIIVVLTILRRRDRAAIVSLVRSARNNMVINGHGPPRPAAIARYESKDVNDKDAFSTGVGGRARHTTAALSQMLENVGSAHSGAENSVDKVEETHDIILEASKKKKSRRKMKSSSVASGALSDSTTTGIKPLRKAPSNQASLISKTAGLLFSPIGFLNGLYSKKTAISSNSDPCISGGTQVSVRRNSASLMEADSLNPILAKTKSLELVPEDECNVFAPLCKTSKIPCAPPPPPTKRFKVTTNVSKKSPNSVFHSSSSKFRGKTRGAGNASVVTG